MKLTRYFEGHVNPVRKGVYERKLGTCQGYSYWNGKWWGAVRPDISDAHLLRECKSNFQNLHWRGIKK